MNYINVLGASVTGAYWTESGTEDTLKALVAEHGAVMTGVYVDNAFMEYKGGIYAGCSSGSPNHADSRCAKSARANAASAPTSRTTAASRLRVAAACAQLNRLLPQTKLKGSLRSLRRVVMLTI